MKCIDEKTMHLLLDGELGKEETDRVQKHLGECKECAAKFKAVRGLVGRIDRFWDIFEKTYCPNLKMLERYSSGRSSPDEKVEIEKHLKMCTICNLKLEKAEELKQAIDQIESEELAEARLVTIPQRIRRIAELISRRFIEEHFPAEISHFAFIFSMLIDYLSVKELVGRKPEEAIVGAVGLTSSHPKYSDFVTPGVSATVLTTLLSVIESSRLPSRSELKDIVNDKIKECRVSKKARGTLSKELPNLMEGFLAPTE